MDLDLLDTDIPSKHFVFLQEALKTSSRNVLRTSSRRLEDQQIFAGDIPAINTILIRYTSTNLKIQSCKLKKSNKYFPKCLKSTLEFRISTVYNFTVIHP